MTHHLPQETYPTYPAPWLLHGNGYMIFYRFSRAFVAAHGFIPPELEGQFDGFFGSLMLVNYTQSPVGPYRELLFIPGKFKTPYGRRYSITRICVDSTASTQWGRANWGIPKTTNAFRVDSDAQQERIEVLDAQGIPFFDITLRSGGLHFPVTTALIPIQLYQQLEGKTYLTTPKGSGKGQLASIQHIQVNAALFPDVQQVKPLLAVKISDFRMGFPVSLIVG